MPEAHPIQGMLETAMENIREMVDVNTVIGDPVSTPDGQTIIPVSRVGFGFAAGGSEFVGKISAGGKEASKEKERQAAPVSKEDKKSTAYPFGGGSGGGVSITPVAFLVVSEKGVRLLSLQGGYHLCERLLESAPTLLEKFKAAVRGQKSTSSS